MATQSRLKEKHIKLILKYWGLDRIKPRNGYPSQNAFASLQIYKDIGVAASLQNGYHSKELIHHVPRIFILVNQAIEFLKDHGDEETNLCLAIMAIWYTYPKDHHDLLAPFNISRSYVHLKLKTAYQLMMMYFNSNRQGRELCELLHLHDQSQAA